MTYLKAESIHPPLHPPLPYEVEQSTSSYSDKLASPFPATARPDSMAPTAENAQHEPHEP